jgi:hypothetical protein
MLLDPVDKSAYLQQNAPIEVADRLTLKGNLAIALRDSRAHPAADAAPDQAIPTLARDGLAIVLQDEAVALADPEDTAGAAAASLVVCSAVWYGSQHHMTPTAVSATRSRAMLANLG